MIFQQKGQSVSNALPLVIFLIYAGMIFLP